MITLFRFGPAWETFGCISQFVLKVETYLRMADIEFSTTSLGATFGETAPKGKLPYIDHDGTTVADSSIIVGYLEEKFDNPLDGSLDALAKAQGHVIQRMVEEHIWWLMARERWWAPENPYWHTPGLLEGVDQASYEAVRDENYRKCNEHGVGAFTDAEFAERGRKDIEALATLLGDSSFLLGDKPTSVDATVYAFLWQIMNAPYTSHLKEAALGQPRLVAYVDRIHEKYFSDDPRSLEREVSAG